MESMKYYYESYNNRDLEEEKQGYALLTLQSAETQSVLTNVVANEALNAAGQKGRKIQIDHGQKSLEMNKKHCPKVFNVTCPLTDKVYPELTIEQLYKAGQFKELYVELSNATNDVNQLKEGLKKS